MVLGWSGGSLGCFGGGGGLGCLNRPTRIHSRNMTSKMSL